LNEFPETILQIARLSDVQHPGIPVLECPTHSLALLAASTIRIFEGLAMLIDRYHLIQARTRLNFFAFPFAHALAGSPTPCPPDLTPIAASYVSHHPYVL